MLGSVLSDETNKMPVLFMFHDDIIYIMKKKKPEGNTRLKGLFYFPILQSFYYAINTVKTDEKPFLPTTEHLTAVMFLIYTDTLRNAVSCLP